MIVFICRIQATAAHNVLSLRVRQRRAQSSLTKTHIGTMHKNEVKNKVEIAPNVDEMI